MTQPSATNPNDALLAADVLRRHGLRSQPFAARAMDGFLYGDPALDMPVGVLLQRLQSENKPLLLVGEHGVGKSTQLLQLLSRGAASLVFCGFKGRRGATFASIEHAIRQQWGRTNIESAMHQQGSEASETPEQHSLAMILLTICRGERRPVLVIDDAHLLGPTVLGMLLRLRREVNRHCGDNTLGVVLAGDPTLEEMVSKAQGAHSPSEPFMTIRLRPLLPPQTDAYLRHRLQAAGAADPELLSGDAARAIHQESSGLPLEINLAANRHLQKLAVEPAGESPDRPPVARHVVLPAVTTQRWVLAALAGLGGLLVGMVLASLFFLSNGQRPQADQPSQAPMPAPVATPEPAPPPQADPPESVPGPIANLPALSRSIPPDDRLPEPSPVSAPRDEVTVESPDRLAEPGSAERDAGPGRVPLMDPVPTGSGEGAAVDAHETETRTDAVPTVPGDPADAADWPPVVVEPPQAVDDAEAAVPEAQAEPVAPDTGVGANGREPPPPATAPAQPAPLTVPAGPRGPEWIRIQESGHFTIQIIAGIDLEALQQFAGRVSLENDVAWFRTRRGDEDWYALVTGQYPDLRSARSAAAQLPAPVRRNQPWIRTFGSIQQTMDPTP